MRSTSESREALGASSSDGFRHPREGRPWRASPGLRARALAAPAVCPACGSGREARSPRAGPRDAPVSPAGRLPCGRLRTGPSRRAAPPAALPESARSSPGGGPPRLSRSSSEADARSGTIASFHSSISNGTGGGGSGRRDVRDSDETGEERADQRFDGGQMSDVAVHGPRRIRYGCRDLFGCQRAAKRLEPLAMAAHLVKDHLLACAHARSLARAALD